MINEVRQTVLAILNKNNYGYISPGDFNLYAEQAQLDLFEDYFYAYNYQNNKENQRTSGTGYADIKKGYEEVIDFFSVTLPLTQNAANVFFMPSLYEGLGIVLIEAQVNGLSCVASDTIPKEADINAGLMNFLSLDFDKNKWRDTILNANRNNNIKDPLIAAKETGYDIKKVSSWLQQFYVNKLRAN